MSKQKEQKVLPHPIQAYSEALAEIERRLSELDNGDESISVAHHTGPPFMFFQERIFNVQQRIIRLIANGVIEMPDMIIPSIPRPIQFLNARFQLLTHGVDMAQEEGTKGYIHLTLIDIDDNKITYRIKEDMNELEYMPDALVKLDENGETVKQYYRDDLDWAVTRIQYVLDEAPKPEDDYRIGIRCRRSGPGYDLRLTYENLTQIGSVITWTPDVIYSLVSGCEGESGAVVIKEVKNNSHVHLGQMLAVNKKAASRESINFTSDENGISFIIPEKTTNLEFRFTRDNDGIQEMGVFDSFSPDMFSEDSRGMLFVFIDEWSDEVEFVLC